MPEKKQTGIAICNDSTNPNVVFHFPYPKKGDETTTIIKRSKTKAVAFSTTELQTEELSKIDIISDYSIRLEKDKQGNILSYKLNISPRLELDDEPFEDLSEEENLQVNRQIASILPTCTISSKKELKLKIGKRAIFIMNKKGCYLLNNPPEKVLLENDENDGSYYAFQTSTAIKIPTSKGEKTISPVFGIDFYDTGVLGQEFGFEALNKSLMKALREEESPALRQLVSPYFILKSNKPEHLVPQE